MKNLMKSLAEFQQECPIIKKLETARIKTKAGGEYTYNYAGLPSIHEIIDPLLFKHGLVLSQPLEYNESKAFVHTILFHLESGEILESLVEIPKVTFPGMNDYQAFGTGITYLRRYPLASILGIVTDEDNDGAAGQGSKLNIIEMLLVSSTLSDDEKQRVENELVDLDADRTEKCIAYLRANQREPVESGDYVNQRDINNKLDKIMVDEKK